MTTSGNSSEGDVLGDQPSEAPPPHAYEQQAPSSALPEIVCTDMASQSPNRGTRGEGKESGMSGGWSGRGWGGEGEWEEAKGER